MTSWVVIDASLLLATYLNELHSQSARNFLAQCIQNNITVAAPALLHYEIVAALRKQVYRGNISSDEGIVGCNALFSYPIKFFIDHDLLRRSYTLAAQFNRPNTYDMQYVAVAERLACDFWTADERLYSTLHDHLIWVKWIGTQTDA